jgi:hypothetical protein
MIANFSVVIFGLPAGTAAADLADMVRPFSTAQLSVQDLPGAAQEAMAVLAAGQDHLVAHRLCERLNQRRSRQRVLRAWMTAMPWA